MARAARAGGARDQTLVAAMVGRALASLAACLAACLSLAAPAAWSQTDGAGGRGFAGLGEAASGFAEVAPGRALRFPNDHGQHPDYRIEWWYLTANLYDAAGARYGVQWTLFRQAQAPGDDAATNDGRLGDSAAGGGVRQDAPSWRDPQIWMAHIAATSAQTHRFEQRLARGGVGQAGVRAAPFEAWLDDWSAKAEGEGLERLRLGAVGDGFSYDLSLAAAGPIVLQGREGYSVKSAAPSSGAAQASYYYSQPHYRASGELTLDGNKTKVSGVAWLDHEWSSQPLAADQAGWDWFALHLSSGEKVMLFQLRRKDGGRSAAAGAWIDPGGRSASVSPDEIAMTPLDSPPEGAAPRRWRLTIPSRALSVEVAPLNPDAWQSGLIPYWEGPVAISGSHGGVGYLEMTGYRR